LHNCARRPDSDPTPFINAYFAGRNETELYKKAASCKKVEAAGHAAVLTGGRAEADAEEASNILLKFKHPP
jgi:hypothetical protein